MSRQTIVADARRTSAKWRNLLFLATLVVGCNHITLATPTKLGFNTQPTGGKINTSLGNVTVETLTVDDARYLSSGSTVIVALGANTTGATLGGNLTAFVVDGLATFPALTVDKPGTYTLVATATGLTSATSTSFTITP